VCAVRSASRKTPSSRFTSSGMVMHKSYASATLSLEDLALSRFLAQVSTQGFAMAPRLERFGGEQESSQIQCSHKLDKIVGEFKENKYCIFQLFSF